MPVGCKSAISGWIEVNDFGEKFSTSKCWTSLLYSEHWKRLVHIASTAVLDAGYCYRRLSVCREPCNCAKTAEPNEMLFGT